MHLTESFEFERWSMLWSMIALIFEQYPLRLTTLRARY
jgi:hypothetical protein